MVVVTWASEETQPYYVFDLTNVSGGNIFVGQLSAIAGLYTCHFVDGGNCANDGGADVPVTYVKLSQGYPTCGAALDYYKSIVQNQYSYLGGERVVISGTPYWIDNEQYSCVPTG